MIKTFALALLLLLSFSMQEASAETKIGSYADYQENVKNYCQLKKEGLPGTKGLWSDWKSDSLIKIDEVQYADIDGNGDGFYKDYLRKLKSDPSRIDTINLLSSTPSYLEKASYVYTETMGAIYACAVLNAKLKITKNLLEIIPTKQSNIKKELSNQMEVIRKRLDGGYCRNVSTEGKELSMKKLLLDNTMYQYCTYRYYLRYLDYSAKNATNSYFGKTEPGSQASSQSHSLVQGSTDLISKIAQMNEKIGKRLGTSTDAMAAQIRAQGSKIDDEAAHAKEIYPQALVAYTEFERTYASHIALMFILQDYVALRDTLNKLMNPIGQVIYKASNAQSPGK